MNMSANYPTANKSYKHLYEAERGKIEAYFSVGLKPADAAHNRYHYAREASYYLKLNRVLDDFLREFTEAMREKPRLYSVNTFLHI